MRQQQKSNEAAVVEKILRSWQDAEDAESREYRGSLATIGRLYGKLPTEDVRATSEAMGLLYQNGLRDNDCDHEGGDGLTRGERASIVVLSLYAGVGRTVKHSGDGLTIGGAIGATQRGEEHAESMHSLMRSLAADVDFKSAVWDASRALKRFSGDITVDYVRLVDDLTALQSDESRPRVLLGWTGDYWSALLWRTDENDTEDKEND